MGQNGFYKKVFFCQLSTWFTQLINLLMKTDDGMLDSTLEQGAVHQTLGKT